VFDANERLEVDVDAATSAYLRRRCSRHEDLAAAAAAALHELAVREAAESLAAYDQRHHDELVASIEDNEQALADAS
jgi:hypothetical protein